MRLEKMPRWVKKRMSDSDAAAEALAIAAAIAFRSCDSSICESGPRFCDCAPPPAVFSPGDGSASASARLSFASLVSAGSGCEKNKSKHAPSAFFSSSDLARVSSSVSRRRPRSSKPTFSTARIASMLSAGETCTPAPRAARKKRCRFSRILTEHVLARRPGNEGRHMRRCGLDVGLVFQEHVERVLDHFVAELGGLQQHQHARPVDGLAHRGPLLQVKAADFMDEADQLPAQPLGDAGNAAFDNALLQPRVG